MCLFYSGFCCHPECRYACDDPVCNAICVAKVSKTNCVVQCNSSFTPSVSQCRYSCTTSLSPNQCEADQCPVADIKCTQLTCSNLPQHTGCQILCEAPITGWLCKKPINCPLPRCELNCEHPACEYSVSQKRNFNLYLLLLFWLVKLTM